MAQREFRLLRDATVTEIPAGNRILLPIGSLVEVTQALGGSLTIRDGGGIYRIEGEEIQALGSEAIELAQQHDSEVSEEGPFSEDTVWQVLKTCYDPEIPINIVDLGLIYNLDLTEVSPQRYQVDVKMTLTATGCGMGPVIAADAQRKIESLPAVESANVEIVWDPQWSPHMISPEGRKVLGLE